MLFRNIVLALGALLVFAGIGLSLFWLSQMGGTPSEVKQEPQHQAPEARRDAVLEAVHPLPAGTLIRSGDFRWHEVEPGEAHPGAIHRNESSETEYLGAIVTRDFAKDEPLATAGLVTATDRRFLSAMLKPGMRAVTIAVDAPQSSSGMVLPGDRVDVVLTQNLGGIASLSNDPSRKSVGETILKDVRVVAVDQRLNPPQTKPMPPEAVPDKDNVPKETRIPRTATLELTEAQAEKLFVAAQLGGLQLTVHALERGKEVPPVQEASRSQEANQSTWASDVSPALKEISRKQLEAEAQQKAQTELLKAQINSQKSMAELQKAQAREQAALAAQHNSRSALLNSQTEQTKAHTEHTKAETELSELDVMLKRLKVQAEIIGGTVAICCVRRPLQAY